MAHKILFKGIPRSNKREPLVELRSQSAREESATRKSLPTKKWGSKDMDRDSSTNTPVLAVTRANPLSYYLDTEDERGK